MRLAITSEPDREVFAQWVVPGNRFPHEIKNRLHETRHLFELRTHGEQEIRILYAFHRDTSVLLHGFIKKSQRLPQKEMKVAEKKYRLLERR